MWKWTILGLIALGTGCGAELETGYKPHKVGVSDTERRGYYASPFSPESRAAEQERGEDIKARRPTGL